MKKFIVFIYLLISTLPFAFSQVDTTQYLIDLRIRAMLNERQKLYSQYSDQIEKKSGFFGNQTKRDIKEANEILLRILATDTRLFRELEEMIKAREREVQKRKYEKQDKEYTILKKEEAVQSQSETVAKLQRYIEKLQAEQSGLKRSSGSYKFLFYTLLIFVLAMIAAYVYRKRYSRA